MKRLALTALAFCLVPAAAFAGAARHDRGKHEEPKRDRTMLHVDLPTRIEQRCNARAMGEVSRQHADMRPEEVVAYAFGDPKPGPASVTAPGAAVRSRGHWYRLSYHCRTSPDGMDVVDFGFELGSEVPRQDWAAHSLVP
ncbi:DUF930 domain-containing protein [Xanthobacter autotrophicus DSM 431]|uniref:DUF930 domain-containing protein n=1 Tax=Xanthobacter nonsaccharivorans TaxID=3119912 RepID=UPI0037297D80